MSRFDRYLLSQLLALFGFFSLVLVLVYWINRAVGLFDDLISDGQSALVFLEFSLLALPNVIRVVLPVSAFVATVYVVNRLSQDSELVVMRATGFSGFRLARPVLVFGLIVTLMMLALTNFLVPQSRAILADRQAEVSADTTRSFLRDGDFLHPAPGITLFIRAISEQGELNDLFLSDERDAGRPVYHTARRAVLVQAEGAPKLVMIDGSIQQLDRATRRLELTWFSDFTFDLAPFVQGKAGARRRVDEVSTAELLRADPALVAETGSDRAGIRFEGHLRLAQPFLGLAAACIGFGALILGSYSRFGLGWQILLAAALLIGVQGAHVAAAAVGGRSEALWALAYAAPLGGLVAGLLLIWMSQRPRRVGRAAGTFAS